MQSVAPGKESRIEYTIQLLPFRLMHSPAPGIRANGSKWQLALGCSADGSGWQRMAANDSEWQLALGLVSWTAAIGSDWQLAVVLIHMDGSEWQRMAAIDN